MLRRYLRGNTIALLGLFLGLSTGAALLLAKHWLANEIITSLEDEVVASCDCSLALDSLSLSLSTLSAKARNVRILDHEGRAMLSFKKITTDIDISEIRSKRVHLKNLTLSEGIADGVGPDSVTFRFIDQLTKPLPPERQRPDRWRVILDNLKVKSSFLREQFRNSELSGSSVSLDVERSGDTFLLSPKIADLRYTSFKSNGQEPPRELLLGPLAASLSIEDAKTIFKSISISNPPSTVDLAATNISLPNKDLLSGSGSFTLTNDYIGLPAWLRFIIRGETEISGSLGSPILNGHFKAFNEAPLTLWLPNAPSIELASLEGELKVDINKGNPIVLLDKVSASSGAAKLSSTKPLKLDDNGLSAAFSISLPNFTYGPFGVKDALSTLTLSEDDKGIKTEINLNAHDMTVQGISLGAGKTRLVITDSDVEVAAETTEPVQGQLKWSGFIDLSKVKPQLKNGSLKLIDFRYPLSTPVTPQSLSPIALTADMQLKGDLSLASISADGATKVHFPALAESFSFSGQSALKNGILRSHLINSNSKGEIDLTLDLIRGLDGRLNIAQPRVRLKTILGHQDECSELGAALAYSFPLSAVRNGSGELLLNTLSIGCAPYSLSAPKDNKIPVRNGALQLKSLKLTTAESALELNGSLGIASGFDMSARGKLELSSLLPLLPTVDDLRGALKTDISIRGALSAPTITGSAQLSNAQFGISDPDLGGHHIDGDLSLAAKSIKINRLSGSLNGGSFSASGTISPLEPANSSLQTTLKGITIEPLEDATITFSGNLDLASTRSQRQLLRGNIDVTFAEVAKDFDINRIIINTISGYLLPSRIKPGPSAKKAVELELDVKLGAPRNIFIVTPFLSAELNMDLSARGSVSNPALEGTMQVLSGWLGLKGNRFDITSGGLTFMPSSLIPRLEMVGEGNLRAPTGESILVILDAAGPLTSPKLSLASDRGLSQSDLLLLLTSSRPLGESSVKGRMDSQFGSDQRFFISDTSFSSFRQFFRNLTKLDILSFEPAYNQFTGTIEPAVIARKNISPRLTLLGESLFSSVSNSRAGGVYALTPSIDINGFFQTVSTQKNSILSSDVTFTVWSEEARFVDITVKGNDNFSESGVLNAARLGPSSRVANTHESLKLIEGQISNYLKENGYTLNRVNASCTEGDTYCRSLNLDIVEGKLAKISQYNLEGDPLPSALVERIQVVAAIGSEATGQKLADIERSTVIALRNEGYIAARVTPSYSYDADTGTTALNIKSELRQPIAFTFSGNTVFNSEELLNSIDLFSRKRPFGNNTITLLMQNIKRMYHEAGYLFVRVKQEEDRSNPERLNYLVSIDEGERAKVNSLNLVGNDHISREEVIASMIEMGMEDQIADLEPSFAVPARLEALRDSITSAYHHKGYPQAEITYSINPLTNSNLLNIVFLVVEGNAELSKIAEVSGYPADLQPPTPPPGSTSLPRINIFTDKLLSSLRDEGYLDAAITIIPNSDYTAVRLSVEPGVRTVVSAIRYEGLVAIALETAEGSTKMKPNSPYRSADVSATKKELLRTGLFSRVEIIPEDGGFDSASEGVIIRVVERPLQTLELGVGANSEFGLHTFGETTNKSLFKDGRSLSMRVDTYFDQGQINPNGSGAISQGFTSLRYSDPKLFDSEHSLNEEVRYQRQELSTQEFNLDRLLVGSYLFRQIRHDLAMTAGHSLVFDNLQDVTPGAIISGLDDGSVRLSFLSGVLKYDRRDDPLLPRSGYTFTLEPKLASEAIGSEGDFFSLIAKSTAIVPLFGAASRYSLGLGLSGAAAQPMGGEDQIPITQRYYLGGRTTVRGFRENSLGPRGDDGAVIGGDTLIAGKTQLQYLADESLSTHIFFDFGNVFLRDYEFNPFDLRTSVGVGFQYLSPIGPIGFDVGSPLDERSGEPSVRVHFSVGSSF